jgi:hypothetical protein
MPARTAFMLPCGKRYPTQAQAEASPRGMREGAVVRKCRGAACGGFHVVSPPVSVAAVPVPRRRDTGPGRKTRLAVYERDGWACACCGTPVDGRPHSVGHRKRRSQGGGNKMSNLLTFLGLGINPLDPDDHHARIDSRRRASDEASGYTVRSYRDPALVPVQRYAEGGGLVREWLTDDGRRVKEAPEGAAA